MKTLGIAIVGCGTVGSGVAALVHARREAIRQRFGVDLELRHLVDLDHSRVREHGLPETLFRTDSQAALEDPKTEVVVELVGGTGFAYRLIQEAIDHRKHIVTANKKLLAEKGSELFSRLRSAGLSLGWEASCGGSIPIIELLGTAYGPSRIGEIHAILNGTTNYILTRMQEGGVSYAEALREAQAEGYAEADPTLDVSGADTAHKITLIAGLAFGRTIPLKAVATAGIQDLSLTDARAGEELGLRMKLLATAELRPEGFAIRVGPAFLEGDHPLAGVRGVFNGITVLGSAFGLQTLIGRGAGSFPTANAVVADLIQLGLNLTQSFQANFDILPGLAPEAEPLPEEMVLRRWLVILPIQPGTSPQLSMAQAGLELDSIHRLDYPQGSLYRIVTRPATMGTLRTVLGPEARCYPIVRTPREVLSPEF